MARKKSGKTIACETCGSTFYTRPSRANRKYCSLGCRKPWNTGLTINDERVKAGVIRASKANIGRKNPKAYFKSSDAKNKIFGENHWNWKGGVHKKNYSERSYYHSLGMYRNLRINILKRDNYTCQICGKRGGRIEVDHIKEWSTHPELRFDENNLRVLCKECHIKRRKNV